VQAAVTKLGESSSKMGEAMYAAAAAEQAGAGDASGSAAGDSAGDTDDDVVDAEIVDDEDESK
jgi:molecular chaperone DnaK